MSVPTPFQSASPAERETNLRQLQAQAAELLALRSQIAALEDQAEPLTAQIKALLSAGYRVTVDGKRPFLRDTRRRVIPYAKFRETFGDKLTSQCLSIDLRQVDALAKQGLLPAAALKTVTGYVDGPPALYWKPVAPEEHAATAD